MRSKDEIVKDEIISAAQHLFRKFGLKKTTMDEIAAECGKGKSTLYHYFKSKEEVFKSVIEKEITNLRRMVKQEVDKAITVQDKVSTYLIKFHTEVLNKLNLYSILKKEVNISRKGQEYFDRIMEYERSYIQRLLEDGYDIGEIKTIEKDDIEWTSEILYAAFIGIVKYSTIREKGFDTEKLKNTVDKLIPKLIC